MPTVACFGIYPPKMPVVLTSCNRRCHITDHFIVLLHSISGAAMLIKLATVEDSSCHSITVKLALPSVKS
jgi:hypothetical protein